MARHGLFGFVRSHLLQASETEPSGWEAVQRFQETLPVQKIKCAAAESRIEVTS